MNWIEVAARAKAMLPTHADYGTKQKSMADVASALGLTRQSLRNILAAHDFLLTIQQSDEEAYNALSQTPYSAVEIYSRWFAYDQEAALAHAVWARKRGASVKSVIGDEKAARSRAQKIGSMADVHLGKLMATSGALSALRPDISRLLSGAGPGNWVARGSAGNFAQAMMVKHVLTTMTAEVDDASALGEDQLLPAIAVIELGERSLAESYRKGAKDFLAKAIAAATVYAFVLVVAPNQEALRESVTALPKPYGQIHSPAAKAQLVIVKPCLGRIMFTSWDRIDCDLRA